MRKKIPALFLTLLFTLWFAQLYSPDVQHVFLQKPVPTQATTALRKPLAWTVCDQLKSFSDTIFEYYTGTHEGNQSIANQVVSKNQVQFFDDPNERDRTIDELILPSYLNKVIRIGDGSLTGGFAGIAKTKFRVKDTFLTIHYRVVFQDPSHSLAQQPFAYIKIRDKNGAAINCGDYLFVAQPGLPGFTSIGSGSRTVRYSDWGKLSLNLEKYINENISIELAAGDCSLRGHFGYMYAAIECGANPKVYPSTAQNLIKGDSVLDRCPGSEAVIEAYEGYQWYLWSNGATTRSTSVTNPGIYTLIVSDSFGCQTKDQIVFSPKLSSLDISPKQFCIDLPINIRLLNYQNQTDPIDSIEWVMETADKTLKVRGKPETVFSTTYDKNFALKTIVWTKSGCKFTLSNLIRSAPGDDLPKKIPLGYNSTCAGSPTLFSSEEFYPLTDWDFDDDGRFDAIGKWRVFHQFPDEGEYRVNMRISNDFGCYKDTTFKVVITPKPNLDFSYQNICVGQQPMFVIDPQFIKTKKVTKIEWDYDQDDGLYFNDYEDKNLTGIVEPSILRNFRLPKKYLVSMRAYTGSTCSDTTTKAFYVHPFHYGGLKGSKYVCKDDLVAKYWLDKSSIYDSGSRVLSWEPVVSRHGIVERTDGDTVYFRCFPNNREVLVKATVITEHGCMSEKFISSSLIEAKTSPKPQGTEFLCADAPEADYFVEDVFGRDYRWQVENGQIVGRSDSAKVRIRWNGSGTGRVSLARSQQYDTICYRASEALQVLIAPKKDTLLAIEAVGMNPPKGLLVAWQTKGEDNDSKLLLKRDGQNIALLDKEPNSYQDSAQSRVYYYQVATFNPCGDTVWSLRHRNIRLDARKVEAQDSIYLRWNSYQNWPSGVKEYQIWRGLEGEDFELIDRTKDTVWASAQGGDAFVHCFVVVALSEQGFTSRSNEACVRFEHALKANAFITPNSDGKNDFFQIQKTERYPNNRLSIFNRWGQIVYQQDNYQNNWAGTSQDGNLLQGTYFFIFNYEDHQGQNKFLSGAITIIHN